MSYAVDVAFGAAVMLAAMLASGHALIFKREARSAASAVMYPESAIARSTTLRRSLALSG